MTKAYKETTSQDIKTIDKYEKIRIVNITKWRPIYEVIYKAYINESNIFPDDLLENVKKSNEPKFISSDVKIT